MENERDTTDAVIDGAERLSASAVMEMAGKVAKNATKAPEGRQARRAAERAAEKAAKKATGKAVGKTVGKAATKSLLKKIPLVSAAFGTVLAIHEISKGNYGKAAGEFASGVAGCIPGVGTMVSFGIDTAMAAYDVYDVSTQQKQADSSKIGLKEFGKQSYDTHQKGLALSKELNAEKSQQQQNTQTRDNQRGIQIQHNDSTKVVIATKKAYNR